MTYSHAFLALGACRLHLVTLSSDWFIGLSTSVVIGQTDYFGFGFTTLSPSLGFQCLIPVSVVVEGRKPAARLDISGTPGVEQLRPMEREVRQGVRNDGPVSMQQWMFSISTFVLNASIIK